MLTGSEGNKKAIKVMIQVNRSIKKDLLFYRSVFSRHRHHLEVSQQTPAGEEEKNKVGKHFVNLPV